MFSPEALSGYLSTAVFTFISVGIMVLVLKHFLLKPLKKVISERQEVYTNEMSQLKKQQEKIEELNQKAQKDLKEVQKKSHELLVEAQKMAEEQAETILLDAKKNAQEILERAESEALHIRNMALQETRDQVIELALNLASKIVAKRLDENKERSFIEKFLKEQCETKS